MSIKYLLKKKTFVESVEDFDCRLVIQTKVLRILFCLGAELLIAMIFVLDFLKHRMFVASIDTFLKRCKKTNQSSAPRLIFNI